MKTSKRGVRVAAVGLIVFGVTACGTDSPSETDASSDSSGASGSPNTVVRAAFTPALTTLQIHLAEEEGCFDERGLDVTLIEGLDIPSWIAALDRQYDMALTTAGFFLTAAEQRDLVAVGGVQVNRAGVLGTPLVTDDDSIRGPADLAGKRIGVATLTGTTPASLAYLVEQAGGDPKSLTLVQVPFANQGDQLAAGQVDAVVSTSPFHVALLQANEAARAPFDVADVALRDIAPAEEQTSFLLMTSTRKWAEAHPEAVKGFRDCMQEKIDWIAANKEEALQKAQEWLGLPAEVLAAAPFPAPVSSTVTEAELQPVMTLLEDQGLLGGADAPDLSNRVVD